jgi:hypothetical protein
MKTKCYSVRLESLAPISAKCYKARSWDGKECLVPMSVVFGEDWEVIKSEAYWIAAWWLEKYGGITFTSKKVKWIDK